VKPLTPAALPRHPALRRSLPKAADRRSPDQSTLVPQLALGHLLHEPVKIFLGEIAAHPAQTGGYLFTNLFLTEGVKFCERGICVDFLFCFQLRCEARESYVTAQCGPHSLNRHEIQKDIFLASGIHVLASGIHVR
jgi:hypothetical protein